ncbi:Helicase conserved C-terminal domain [Ceratobasidium sp. AG-Ba]|nr:Helicase conserved C-terminal domain [Ceratobasidium sp. AG-Ba]
MVEQLKHSLRLGGDVEVIRCSNDRPNIIPVVYEMQHSAQSFFDVAFLIPLGLTANSPRPRKFLLFMNSRDQCVDAGKFLRARLPLELRDKVVWVHADMSREFCAKALADLREGKIFGIVCTDVVGMGIDIPDIELVVQFQLPIRFCTLFQRFGRCARSVALVAIAILIVESKYFDDTKKRLGEQAAKRQEREAAKKRKANESRRLKKIQPSQQKYDANVTEVSRRSQMPLSTRIYSPLPHLDLDAVVCPVISFSQTLRFLKREAMTTVVLAVVDRHPLPDSPPESKRAPNQIQLQNEDPEKWSDTDHGLREALEIWRDETAAARWGRHHMIGGVGLLGDEQIERIVPLARQGLIQTVENLKRHIPKWHYHDRYGSQILNIILGVYPAQSNPAPPGASVAGATSTSSAPAPKRPRAQVHCGVCGEAGHNSERPPKSKERFEVPKTAERTAGHDQSGIRDYHPTIWKSTYSAETQSISLPLCIVFEQERVDIPSRESLPRSTLSL